MDNQFAISSVNLSDTIKAHCPLGSQWYSADVSVEVYDPTTIPDYVDLTDRLHMFDGCTLTVEELCHNIHCVCCDEFMPSRLKVTVEVGRGKHMPVTIVRDEEYGE